MEELIEKGKSRLLIGAIIWTTLMAACLFTPKGEDSFYNFYIRCVPGIVTLAYAIFSVYWMSVMNKARHKIRNKEFKQMAEDLSEAKAKLLREKAEITKSPPKSLEEIFNIVKMQENGDVRVPKLMECWQSKYLHNTGRLAALETDQMEFKDYLRQGVGLFDFDNDLTREETIHFLRNMDDTALRTRAEDTILSLLTIDFN